ncbi:hypothetical protein C9374_000990 [Naegleria lovaniensis]|uniref:Sulfite exporter TauE/SafE n=1 Tax=Naegleria lovaniensis TaxID=51637 RepID=A0AA88GW95_NAELO|nr:uncharacterized protein C9374_000990 [Naegleria lovaniensis]KAG2388140.1 hypothetical protein C9374_000990 [Naegleria lovaniensis]
MILPKTTSREDGNHHVLRKHTTSLMMILSVFLLSVVMFMANPIMMVEAKSSSVLNHRSRHDATTTLSATTTTTTTTARVDMNGAITLATYQNTSGSSGEKLGYVTNYQVFIGRNCTPETVEKDCGGLETLVCINNKCSFCTNATQCSEQIHTIYSCHKIGKFPPAQGGVCEHKDLFEYVSYLDVLATITCFIGGVLSAASGTGGGGIFVPLLHVAGQFPPSLAVPISTLMIFGAGIINIATLSFKRHPHADRPLIDYDIALMMEPPTLLGTIIGVFFNMMFPDWLIVVLVILTLSITSFVMFRNGYKRFKLEAEARKKAAESTTEDQSNSNRPTTDYNQVSDDEESLLKVETTNQKVDESEVKIEHHTEEEQTDEGVGFSTRDPEEEKELKAIYEAEKKTPLGKILVLIICWLTVFTLSLLKGGHGTPSIIPSVTRCSVGYWILTALSFPLLGAMALGIIIYLLKKHERKVQLGYQFVEGDVHWNKYNVTIYPVACIGAGILASMLGIGGGMVKSPLLLILGSDPVASQATTSFMILFTSSISTVQYLIAGMLPWDYGLWFLATGILCGIFGQLMLDLWLDKTGRRSIMIFIVAFVTLIATFLMGGAGIYDIVKSVERNVYMGFKSPCL